MGSLTLFTLLKSWGLIKKLEDIPLLQVETALVNAFTCQDLLSPTNLVGSRLVDVVARMDNKILSVMTKKRGRAPSSSSNSPPPLKKTNIGHSKAIDKSPEVSIHSGDRSSPLPPGTRVTI